MALAIPSLDDLHTRILADYESWFPTDDVGIDGDAWRRTRVLAGLAWLKLHHLSKVEDDLSPLDAEGEFLDRIGKVYDVTRKGATPARKANALRVTGTAGSILTIGDELTYINGIRYQINENATMPSAEFIDVDIVAIDVGSQTKIQGGEIAQFLTFTTPPAGIDADAELQLDVDEDGEDQERDAAYRVRILDKIAQPAMGGNANDYRTWALEVTGIASAFVYPTRAGRGSVDLAALHTGRGSARVLTLAERTELADYINGTAAIESKRPTAMKSFRVLETTTTEVDVDMQIKELPGYTWDWDDSGGALTVSTWTAGTRTLEFTTDRPSDMEAGDRIIIKTAAGNGTGEQFEIEALGAAADEVILRTTPTTAPVATDTVYSGGDLVKVVRDAVLAFFDALGPAVGTTGVGDWIADVEPEHLLAIALQQTGVRNGQVNTPSVAATPSDPAFPNDDTIGFLIPGEVVVRRLV